ncbi:MAG: carboxypeptidase regulatory-like domain-containing protein [Bacteroidetes bacterium]|nr:MAG: carboxypeptidase regulatory-like domain-containing protein [Bacteroidota bacterium]
MTHSTAHYFLICLSAILILTGYQVMGQDHYQQNNPASFRDREAEVRPGQLISNVVRVVNPTRRAGEFSLRIDAPAGWQVVGFRERVFTMGPADTLFFPVRVIAFSGIQEPEPQIISASLMQQRNMISSESWVVLPVLQSAWNASASRNQIILTEYADTASFTINVVNTGDITEWFTLETEQPPGVFLLDEKGEISESLRSRFSLKPLQDTIIRFSYRVVDEAATETERFATGSARRKRVRVSLSAEPRVGAGRSWNSNVEIRKLSDKWVQNKLPYASLPLTIEFNAMDILSENAYGDLFLYGSKFFNENTTLSYFFQANFISNYLNPTAFLGQYLNINFQSKYFGVELGKTSIGTTGYALSGDGVKVTGKYDNHRLHLGYVASPGVFDSLKIREGISAEYVYAGRTVSGSTFFQRAENFIQKTDDQLMGGNLSYRFLGTQFVRVTANMTQQSHLWNPDSVFTVEGLGYSVNYSGRFNNLGLGMMYASSTADNLIRKGMESLSARASWRFNRQNRLAASWSSSKSQPNYYFRGQPRELNQERVRETYRLNYQYSGTVSSVSFSPVHYDYEDRFLSFTRSGAEVDYRLLSSSDFRFSVNTFLGYSTLPDSLIDPFFVANIRTNFRYFQYNLNLRYYYGPYFSNELRRFADTGRSFNRFAANLFFEEYFFRNSVMLRFSSLYNYSTYNHQSSVSVRPELYYFVNSGLRFGVYGRFFGMSVEQEDMAGLPDLSVGDEIYQYSRYEFGFSVKKDLNVPISGRRFYDFTVLVYRDVTGTGSRESRDPGVSEVWVRMQYIEPSSGSEHLSLSSLETFEAVTNRDGKAFFTHIPPGNYLLTLLPVAASGARFEARTYEVMVSSDRTLDLSIDRGARVAGAIVLERDQYTQADYFPVNNIRVTATNPEGQQFSTLTTNNGQFSLYLQKGSYTISVNENVFSDLFTLQNNNIPIDVVYEHEVITVNFVARERTRQIRIQRPGEQPEND